MDDPRRDNPIRVPVRYLPTRQIKNFLWHRLLCITWRSRSSELLRWDAANLRRYALIYG